MLYRFAGFELDSAAFTLSGPDGIVPIEPLVFDLIHFFLRTPDAVLTRDVLIEEVWKGRIVSDATLSSAIKAARRALGDDGETQAMIRTVRGRGFVFVAKVASAAPQPTPRRAPTGANNPPSLNIGPLRAIGVTPELGALSDALTGNLATILTRVPLLQVTAADAPAASAALQLRGDLQSFGGAYHANIQLIDNHDGHLLWGRQFRQPIDDEAVSGLLEQVLPRLEPQLVRAIGQGAENGDARGDARSLLIKATGVLTLKGWSRRSFEESARLLREAIAQDENLALAHAQLALILALGARFGILSDQIVAEEAARHVDRALELDDLDSTIAGATGCALADIGQTRRARPLLKKAIDLNPNNAQAWTAMGALHLVDGEYEEAVAHLEKGLSISPMDPRRSVWGGFLAVVHLLRKDIDAAIRTARVAAEDDERNYMPHLALAAALLLKGEARQAAEALRDARRVKPDLNQIEMVRLLGEKLATKVEALKTG